LKSSHYIASLCSHKIQQKHIVFCRLYSLVPRPLLYGLLGRSLGMRMYSLIHRLLLYGLLGRIRGMRLYSLVLRLLLYGLLGRIRGTRLYSLIPRLLLYGLLGRILASFPGRSHLQYLIAYSMQIRRGKAWEIWSRAVMSGRQKVDTWGRCPPRNLKALSCTIGPRAGGQSVSKSMSIPSVVHSARDCSTQNRNYYYRACTAPPPVCLPSVYLT